MENLNYIFGLPIEIEGFQDVKLYPLSIIEFNKNQFLFNVLNIGVNLLLQQMDTKEKLSNKDKEQRKEISQKYKDFDVLCSNVEQLWTFSRLVKLCFHIEKDEDLRLGQDEQGYPYMTIKNNVINRNNYNKIRYEILKVNNIKLPKVAPTKELQEWFNAEANSDNKSSKIDMQDIITSIMVYCSFTPKQLSEFTVYQINQLIARINKICEYEANIQFLCAGADSKEIKIDSGIMAHIDDSIEEKEITVRDTIKKFNAMLGK